MSPRGARRLAWSLWTLSVALLCAGLVFRVLNSSTPAARPPGSPVLDAGFLLLFLSFATVGALVVSRQPGNLVGWVFCAMGLFTPVATAGEEYAVYALVTRSGSLPGAEALVWLAAWVGGPIIISMLAFVFLFFPDGRLLSPRWRLVVWLDLIAIALLFAWHLEPGPIENSRISDVENPFGLPGAAALLEVLGVTGFWLALAAAIAGAVSLVLRLRRSRGDERQQLKWFVFAGAVFCAVFLTGPVLWSLPSSPGTAWIWPALFLLGVGAIPVATGIAILKYRLYDIDLVVNRTLVYATLTALLVTLYLGSVVALQYALRALTGGGSQLAVVASTLAIAALFGPLRRRVQGFIDRRFYRRKYDAAKTLETFGAKLRDDFELEALSTGLVEVVRETVQPAHVSLWLRGPGEEAG